MTKVEFFNGTTKLGEDTTSPYTFAWSGAGSGSYPLTAKATDNAAQPPRDSPSTITVNAPPNGEHHVARQRGGLPMEADHHHHRHGD